MIRLLGNPAIWACAAVAALTLAPAQKAAAGPHRACTHPWEEETEPFRIAGNLYYVGNAGVSSHLIDTGEGLILIDTAFPQTVYLLLESIRQLGFDPKDIVYILHTHAHYDHMGGTKALVELTKAKAVMGKEDAEMMDKRPELTWAPQYGLPFHEGFKVDRTLSDGDTVSLGSTTITCVHTPGHTPGCFSYFFDVTESGKTYRAGIFGGPGLNTLSDSYLKQYDLPISTRDDYLKTLERLKQEPVDIMLGAHPGQSRHFQKRAAVTADKNPFVNKADWPAFLDMMEDATQKNWGTK